MTTLLLDLTPTSVSLALLDDWGGITPLLPEHAVIRQHHAVPCLLAKQAAMTCVGATAESFAAVAAGSGPPVRVSGSKDLPGLQAAAPVIAAAVSELQRQRLTVSRVIVVAGTGTGAADSPALHDTRSEIEAALRVCTAGWPEPECLPRALAIAGEQALSAGAGPLHVLEIRHDAVTLSEVLGDAGEPACRLLARQAEGGLGAVLEPQLEALLSHVAASGMPVDLARIEASRLQRLMLEAALQPRSDSHFVHAALRPSGVVIERLALTPLLNAIERWVDALQVWLDASLPHDAPLTMWVEDLGVSNLASGLQARLRAATARTIRIGTEPVLGAARIAGTGIKLDAAAGRLSIANESSTDYGILRPTPDGDTEFRSLGPLSDLRVQQKLTMKTTREDQTRLVLPIAICEHGQAHQLLGILEFPLAAPAKKGVPVEFYIEHRCSLLRIRGVTGQTVVPVGEAFVPLDARLAQDAADYRKTFSQLGLVL